MFRRHDASSRFDLQHKALPTSKISPFAGYWNRHDHFLDCTTVNPIQDYDAFGYPAEFREVCAPAGGECPCGDLAASGQEAINSLPRANPVRVYTYICIYNICLYIYIYVCVTVI